MPQRINRQRPKRPSRVGQEIRRILYEMFQRGELHDPRFGPLTITEVRCNDSLGSARVFFLPAERDPSRIQEILDAFDKAGGYIQGRIGRELRIRKVPKLHFVYDDLDDKSREIGDLLDSVRQESDEEPKD